MSRYNEFERIQKIMKIGLTIYIAKNDDGEDIYLMQQPKAEVTRTSVANVMKYKKSGLGLEFATNNEPVKLKLPNTPEIESYTNTDNKNIFLTINKKKRGYRVITHKSNGKRKEKIIVDDTVEVSENEFADEIGKSNPALVIKKKTMKRFENHKIERTLENWKANDFLKYMNELYKQTYKMESAEFNRVNGEVTRSYGRLFTTVKKKLQDVFDEFGMDNKDLKKYIDWIFKVKSQELDFHISLAFVASPVLIDEWRFKVKNKSYVKPLSRQDKVKFRAGR